MRQKTVEQLERFWSALVATAHGPLCKTDYPFGIAAKCGIDKQTARGMLKHLHNAGYIMPIHRNDERGMPLVGAQLLKTEFTVADFTKPKVAKERKPKIATIAPPTPMFVTIRKPRVAVFIDCDNLCIKLQQRNSVLEVATILQKAAEEGDFVVCFGFVQRKTLERHREAINGFPRNIGVMMSADYSQASDEQMLDTIKLFAKQNFADVFFIGTADQQLFESAQKIVRETGKRAALLDCCELSVGIKSEADRIVRVQNAAVPLNKQRLQQCAERIAKTKRLGRGAEAEFLRNVVRKLRNILSGERSLEFRELQKSVWRRLHRDYETIGWHPQDCQYALEALRTLGILMQHQSGEKTYYRLNREAETHGVF